MIIMAIIPYNSYCGSFPKIPYVKNTSELNRQTFPRFLELNGESLGPGEIVGQKGLGSPSGRLF